MRTGIFYTFVAYILWGLFPLWFKAVQHVPAEQVLLHRVLWAFALLALIMTARRQWTWLGKVLHQPHTLKRFGLSAALLCTNWFVYIWAVHHDRVVDASLGYFINPLVSIVLGCWILKERLDAIQWTTVALATAGVVWLTWQRGSLPWIGLTIGIAFGVYGLLRKTAPLGALKGLTLETLLLAPFAGAWLLMLSATGSNAFTNEGDITEWLLISAGPVTAIPLLLFAAGARRIPLSILGLLQYIGPTLQLLLGVWLYNEPFGTPRLVGFGLIWAGLAVYSADSLWKGRTKNKGRKEEDVPHEQHAVASH